MAKSGKNLPTQNIVSELENLVNRRMNQFDEILL